MPHTHTHTHTRSAPSSNDEWYTPLPLIRALGKFDFDPACGPKCPHRTARIRIGPDRDGLSVPWRGRVWCNPPFSNAAPFVHRMIEHGNGVLLVFFPRSCRWFERALRASGGFFMIEPRPKFLRPNGELRVIPNICCLLPFGKANRQAIFESGISGLWLECGKKGESRK